jgi:hypothetical protein
MGVETLNAPLAEMICTSLLLKELNFQEHIPRIYFVTTFEKEK